MKPSIRRLAAVAAVAMFALACHRTPMQRLTIAARGVRFAEARLCGFAYAPPRPIHRGAQDAVDVSMLRLKASAADLLASATSNDPETRRTRAAALLIAGNPEKAVKELESLVAVDRNDARVWSDLAAARYELARKDDDAQSFASALAAAANAIDRNDSLPEAQSNYALAAVALHLDGAAAGALRKYLTLDGTSEWAIDVRRRLAYLQRPKPDWQRTAAQIERNFTTADIQQAVAEFPQQARTWAEGEYLARWAEAYLAHRDAEAGHWLSLSRSIGDALRRQSGESLLHDAVTAIDSAAAPALTALAKAHLTYRRGRILYSKQAASDAIPLLTESERLFVTGRSPVALVAMYYRANALTEHEQNEPAMNLLGIVERKAMPQYVALSASVLWQKGYLFGRSGRLYDSLNASTKALALFERNRERENIVRLLTNITGTLAALGRPHEAWEFQRRSLSEAAISGNPLLLEHALNVAARNEIREGHAEIGRTLLDIELAMPTFSPRLRVDALVQRMKVSDTIGTRMARIRTAVTAIPDLKYRQEAEDDVRFSVALKDEPESAIRSLTDTISFRTANHLMLSLPEAYLARARAYRRLANMKAARSDLETGIALAERQRGVILRDDLRDTFFDTVSDIYDEAFDVYSGIGDYRDAFRIAEHSRARLFLDRLRDNGASFPTPLSADTIAALLPEHTVIAHYTIVADRIVIFTIGNRAFSACTVPAKNITAAITAFTESLDGRSSEVLYDTLVTPIAGDISRARHLVVVPDARLAPLPFAALRSSHSHRFLIEDIAISIAPSATAYASGARLCPADPPRRALLIGNPAVDRSYYGDLSSLGGSEEEVRRLASNYQDSVILTGKQASKQDFLRMVATSDVVHIGAHAMVSAKEPSRSAIVLAGTNGSGALYLSEVAATNLPKRPIVVLATCRSAFTARARGSIRSLAFAFLLAGSRSVIGTLWDIDDEQARGFTADLHHALAGGDEPAFALQRVQIRRIRATKADENVLRTWSGFEDYGL